MNVSRSSYYEWFDRPQSSRDLRNKELTDMIIEIFNKGRQVYGTRQIAKNLAKKGLIVSRRRIGKLMKAAGIVCKTKRKFKAATDSKHKLSIAPNLLKRQLHVAAPNRYWVGDITCV
jgi:putative transposase